MAKATAPATATIETMNPCNNIARHNATVHPENRIAVQPSARPISWPEIASQIRPAAALAEALAGGYVDNHGDSIGDIKKAGHRLELLLERALASVRKANG